ncbi:type III secretion system gatekeeper subunit SctW [Martelella alba]|uniref:YopN family type III secretion system gatekeeper subunit n=1 Tax=Martelella alba TaxID=2590451 RepID=A0ABY2SI82_9HYPH|nr:type III secretion system gatekeeper subunit SctW [Martelella alba]TKI05086.1 YopN family type III secretion system gatekeeper subunit [Martelella alba]
MAIGIGNHGASPSPYTRTESTGSGAQPAADSASRANEGADETPAGQVQKFVQSSDELSAAASQFANRRLFEKKGNAATDSFERVLDEDATPKARALLRVAAVRGESLAFLLRYARSLFPDDSDLIMVLRELLRRETDKTQKKRLQALLDEAESEGLSRDTKAGINCALKARLFGHSHLALKPGLLRGSYRRFLSGEGNGTEDYKDWIAAYGFQHRADVLHFIEAALLADIDSLDPSCSRREFGDLINKLGHLKRLRSGDAAFIRKLSSHPATGELDKSEAEWLVLFFSFLQYPERPGEHLYAVLGERFLMAGHGIHSTIIQAIFQACKSLPIELFDNAESLPVMLDKLRDLAAIAYGREINVKRR